MRCVVDDHVDAAHELSTLRDPFLHGVVIGQIDIESSSLVALGLQLFGTLGGNALGAAGTADVGAMGAQQLLGDLAHALGGAGQQDALAFQALANGLLGSDVLAKLGSTGDFRGLCHDGFLSISCH